MCCLRLGNVRISSCDDSYIDTLIVKDEKELITDKGKKKRRYGSMWQVFWAKETVFVLFQDVKQDSFNTLELSVLPQK